MNCVINIIDFDIFKKLVSTFYNVTPKEYLAKKNKNNYHSYAPNGAIS